MSSHVGGLSMPDLVANVNTPAYVLDETDFRMSAPGPSARRSRRTTSSTPARRSSAPRVARWVADEGLCLDVCSNSELTVALRAGFEPAKIGYHGNNKTMTELRRAIAEGVGRIVVDSFDELDRLGDHHRASRTCAPG